MRKKRVILLQDIFIIIFFIICLSTASALLVNANDSVKKENTECKSAYCEGWEDGYVKGYCYKKVGCVTPIVPPCPIPDPYEDSYTDGYNDGFLAGLNNQ